MCSAVRKLYAVFALYNTILVLGFYLLEGLSIVINPSVFISEGFRWYLFFIMSFWWVIWRGGRGIWGGSRGIWSGGVGANASSPGVADQ